MLQFLKVFLDIVLWRRGPQDLPVSPLLFGLVLVAYTAASILQLVLKHEPAVGVWFVALVLDPVALVFGMWFLLKLFDKQGRFLQAVTAMLGAGTVLTLGLFLPVQWAIGTLGVTVDSPLAAIVTFALVGAFALVNGRIIELATDSNLYTGVAVSLTYFLLMISLLDLASGGGS